MAFPTTGVLDDFNRADAATLGANWSANPVGTAGRHRVASNEAKRETGTANTADYYSAATYGPDSECFVTVSGGDWVGTDSGGVFVRLVNPGAGTGDAYRLSFRANDNYTLFRYDNGTATALGADFSVAGSTGDSHGIEAIGSTIKAYHKPSGGAWTEVASRTDSTYSAAGHVALAMFNTGDGMRFDDFGGGTVSGAGAQQIDPSGVASEEAFGTPTFTFGAVSVAPMGIASEEAFGTPSFGLFVSPAGIASEEAFGAPTLQLGAVAVAPTGIASEEAFGAPSVSAGGSFVEPTGIASEEAFGAPTFTLGTTTVNVTGIPSEEAFGSVGIVGGVVPQGTPTRMMMRIGL